MVDLIEPRQDFAFYVIVGIDTEYASEADLRADGRRHNELLCYSFFVIDVRTGRTGTGIYYPSHSSGRGRIKLETAIARALSAALDGGIIDKPPERILLAFHYSRADLPMFRGFGKTKKHFDGVRRTFATTTRPTMRTLRFNGRMHDASLTLVDTTLLAPAGQQSLDNLGTMLGVPKDELPEGHEKANMTAFMQDHPALFERYALRDAEITARWTHRMICFQIDILDIGSKPAPTLASMAVRLFSKMSKDQGRDLGNLLGRKVLREGCEEF